MNRKTTKILTTGLLLAFIIGLAPAYANAAVLSWILGNKAVNLQSKLTAFAGVGENTGINFLNSESENVLGNIQFLQSNSIVAANEPSSTPIKSKKKENRVYIVPASAYSSTKDQLDHTPFITASCTHDREGVTIYVRLSFVFNLIGVKLGSFAATIELLCKNCTLPKLFLLSESKRFIPVFSPTPAKAINFDWRFTVLSPKIQLKTAALA